MGLRCRKMASCCTCNEPELRYSFAMMRPSTLSPPRSPRTPRVQAPRPARGGVRPPDSRGSLITTAMTWVLIVSLVVPLQYFTGDMLLNTAVVAMAAPNPMARAIKLVLLALSVVLLLWKSRTAWLEARMVNPFFWAFMALVPASVLWSVARDATINRYLSLCSIAAAVLRLHAAGVESNAVPRRPASHDDGAARGLDHFRASCIRSMRSSWARAP